MLKQLAFEAPGNSLLLGHGCWGRWEAVGKPHRRVEIGATVSIEGRSFERLELVYGAKSSAPNGVSVYLQLSVWEWTGIYGQLQDTPAPRTLEVTAAVRYRLLVPSAGSTTEVDLITALMACMLACEENYQ